MKLVLLSLTCTFFVFASFSQPKFSKQLSKFYKFVPAGMVVMGKDTLSVQAFYMFNHETTNFQWKEFQMDLEKNGKTAELEMSRVRGENWTMNGNSSKPMAEHYHTHPAYREYPVVNITHEAAERYCLWVTEKLNSLSKPLGVKVHVRLPFHAELIRAGVGDQLGAWYPWKHEYMQNTKGEFLANFTRVLNSQITREENGEWKILPYTGADVWTTQDVFAPSISFWPSEFGIYNLSGNVAEMINTPGVAVGGSWRDFGYDIRLQSTKKYEESAIDVGFRMVVAWLPN
jgi:formylglycine-generating enzyme required for sulfatase activity